MPTSQVIAVWVLIIAGITLLAVSKATREIFAVVAAVVGSFGLLCLATGAWVIS